MTERHMRRQTTHSFSETLGSSEPQASRDAAETRLIQTVVFATIPEFDQVKVRDGEGHVYALTRKTRGVQLDALHEGQHVLCTVTRKLPRVISAEAFA